MSVGKNLAKGTVNAVGSVFGIAGALVGIVGDFAEGLVSETAKSGDLLPREESETEMYLKAIVAGMKEFKQSQDKIEAKLESITNNQSDLEKKLESVMARLAALEGKDQQAE